MIVASKENITDLSKKGKTRPSRSPYGSPLLFVKSKENIRGVVNYQALNRVTKPNNCPIPRTDKISDRLAMAKYFSKLDLKTGFHQIHVSSADIKKTDFKTQYDNFEFLIMLMGLCNASATFQSLTNQFFYDFIPDFLVVYFDNLLIFDNSKEEHLGHLRLVIPRLCKNELYDGEDKFEIMRPETEFIGLMIRNGGVDISQEQKQAAAKWPCSNTLSELHSIVGLLQFFLAFY